MLDRLSKFFVLTKVSSNVVIIPHFFTISKVWNKGVSWSLLSFDSTLALRLLTALILCVIVSFGIYTFINHTKGHNVTLEVIVLAGALSNVVDRFLYGAVLDFLEFHIGTWYWPTFNLADAFVIVGIFGLIIKNSVETYVTKN